ncbi:hypothetical protein [Pelomonas sp. SE-A7]|uniref:hypothetical protein n=1 Tax=Pelomonas sp. SE-A7 TaxID=3054953 RepID=UPI00259C92F1|nr:hypothetical protein [Pelomonas sp. SE-A7]MDM4765145.1 hypothetical protein [Pelomonas sp. SE-A7]
MSGQSRTGQGARPRWLAGALTLLAMTTVSAEGLRLAGFGTLGQVSDNRSNMAPARDVTQRPRDGEATGSSWRVDSRLGLQAELPLGSTVDLVGQLLLRDQDRVNFNNSLELAYLALRPRADVNLRLGRVSYDAFLMSDHRNVGYAYTWVRPPLEFYGWLPIFSIDGGDASYVVQSSSARWIWKAQLGTARGTIPIGAGYDFRADRLWSLSLSRQGRLWRLKLAHSRFTSARDPSAFAALHQGLDQVAAASIPGVSTEAAELRTDLAFKGARISYTTLGAAFDNGTWVAQAELGRTTSTQAVLPHGRMAYLGLGRRFGDWTPFLLHSVSRPGNGVRGARNDWGAFNATLRDPALFTVNTTRIDQRSSSLGLRWDLLPQAALKLQWDHTEVRPSGYGLWWRSLAINMQGRSVNSTTLTLDFSF